MLFNLFLYCLHENLVTFLNQSENKNVWTTCYLFYLICHGHNMYGLEISTYNSKVYIFGHLYLRFFSYVHIRKRKRIACFSGINETLINLRHLASHGKFEVLWTSFLWVFLKYCMLHVKKRRTKVLYFTIHACIVQNTISFAR